MIYVIIAAGKGSRLASEGVTSPKPMVCVDGTPLVARLARIMASRDDCERIEVIVNENGTGAKDLLEGLGLGVPLHVTVRDTPGSLHSLAALLGRIGPRETCVSTVDTVFLPKEFDLCVDEFLSSPSLDALMAVTAHVDDEKPLYVATTPDGEITGFLDNPAPGIMYVSGGIYLLRPSALELVDECIRAGQVRMRDFQRSLTAAGLRLRARPFSRIIDVDHAADIAAAEDLLKNEKTNH